MSPLKDVGRSPPMKDSAPMPTTRRSKSMPTDSPGAKFLYTIIKQLDLKGIDWSLVASQLEISNGHAARMRYHRFRNQMEGITSKPRKKDANKPSKSGMGFGKEDLLQHETSPEPSQSVKSEPLSGSNPYIKTEQASTSNPYIKTEPRSALSSYIKSEPYPCPPSSLDNIPHVMSDPFYHCSPQPGSSTYTRMAVTTPEIMFSPIPIYPPIHTYGSPVPWTPVKVEPKIELKEDVRMEETLVRLMDCEGEADM
ncbi:hypothetical protein BJX99DRAFT_258134 [Aspergillus californicus]